MGDEPTSTDPPQLNPPGRPASLPSDEEMERVSLEFIRNSPEIRAGLTPYRSLASDEFDLNQAFENDGSDEGWMRELIGHIELIRRTLESRHVKILAKIREIRRILVEVEVLSARQWDRRVWDSIQRASGDFRR